MGFGNRIPSARKERGKIKAAFPPVPIHIDFHVTETDPMEGCHVQQVTGTEESLPDGPLPCSSYILR